ncbi:hypothetical protein [Paenibacillus sp. FSL A5-0031]|uniref:hypothetical protein n=1 Tax=Paenibacillus sp. FSL A5-0031 TaxID=1920420 RepID=UPI0011855E33|nr:hypothetical protein [Paenibacillus sp. FSL A5-0031]
MMTYVTIGAIVITTTLLEKRSRDAGNTDGALTARRFGRYFLLGSGAMIAYEWVSGMLALML